MNKLLIGLGAVIAVLIVIASDSLSLLNRHNKQLYCSSVNRKKRLENQGCM